MFTFKLLTYASLENKTLEQVAHKAMMDSVFVEAASDSARKVVHVCEPFINKDCTKPTKDGCAHR